MWKALFGTVKLRITSADPASFLNLLGSYNIYLYDVESIDDLSFFVRVSRKDAKVILALVEKTGDRCTLAGRLGVYWRAKGLSKRPILLVGLIIYLLFILIVPTRVLFIQVEGNMYIPDREVIEAAQKCGISFGSSRRAVRSEKVKNALLRELPQLQWAGVNTTGCVAVISVRERQLQLEEKERLPCSIVAKCDGIVRSCTVLRGTQLCKVGQAVKAGQILVSGYKDYGIAMKLSYAEAEIFAETEHNVCVLTPSVSTLRTKILRKETKYSLQIGKKQINFFKDSGISPVTCVKMYKRTYLTLPGGFVLPIALVKQEITYYTTESLTEQTPPAYLNTYSEKYLLSQMLSGSILKADAEIVQQSDAYILSGSYACLERIGETKYEEQIKRNE